MAAQLFKMGNWGKKSALYAPDRQAWHHGRETHQHKYIHVGAPCWRLKICTDNAKMPKFPAPTARKVAIDRSKSVLLPQNHSSDRQVAYHLNGQFPMADLRLALYQPDIPGNTGTILRLAACLGFAVDIIEPAGFDISDRNLKRAGMDYLATAALTRHVNWERFEEWRAATGRRLILATTKASQRYTDFVFRPDDILLFGRESAGVPDHVHERADGRILIPMVEGQRSINLAVSAAMITGEAMRQTVWS
jgi:tRNA (cytidine/uridine-2'-O-)-methyltransferase